MLEPAIVNWLEGDVNIAAVVGTRIYPAGDVPEQDQLPRLTYQRIDTDHAAGLDGSHGFADGQVQINCVSRKRKEARTLAELVRLRMLSTSFQGTIAGVVVKGARIEGDGDTVELPQSAEEKGVSGVALTFRVWFKEVIPA